jgi:hypothetical protein
MVRGDGGLIVDGKHSRELPGLGGFVVEIERRVAGGRSLLESADEVCSRIWTASNEEEPGKKAARAGKRVRKQAGQRNEREGSDVDDGV